MKNKKKKLTLKALKKDFRQYWVLYLMFLPILGYIILFGYVPMVGVSMAFMDFRPRLGYLGSDFVGFANFTRFFSSPSFWKIVRNTFSINLLDLFLGFPTPIIFALLLFEMSNKHLRKTVQFIAIAPHFISVVVLCGMITVFSRQGGWLNSLVAQIKGVSQPYLLEEPNYYYPIYLLSSIWAQMGFASIVYYAALCGVDKNLIEAAKIDGAGRMRQMFSVTIPSISPTIIIMFILRMGGIFAVGLDKSLLLQTRLNENVSEVLSTYVYKRGLLANDYGYGMATSLFSAAVNLTFLLITNTIARKTETSLW